MQATVLQWTIDYHPAGKFSTGGSRFNLNGRFAWSVMEIVGPVQLVYILWTLPGQLAVAELPAWNKIAAALYVVHYFNRSVVNPLFVASSISPVGPVFFLFAAIFNWFNSACLGAWLVGYDTQLEGFETGTTVGRSSLSSSSSVRQVLPFLGLGLFALGMINNIRAERTLWRLRREEAHRSAAETKKKDDKENNNRKPTNPYAKVYVIPPARGLFGYTLYPHYGFEWIEWVGFALVATAVSPSSHPPITTPPIKIAPWFIPLATVAERWRMPLPLPALVFLVNNVTTMLPQARRGLKWYKQRFGEQAVAGRTAVVPGVPFL